MSRTIIVTDGSSRGNPGPGGWAALMLENGQVRELGGREKETTNNRMELSAIIEGLKTSESNNIDVYTDSSYVVNGITKWILGWKQNGWQTKDKKEVLNKDLWLELDDVASNRDISWRLVPGHAGVAANERADVIATECADGNNPTLYQGSAQDYSIDIAAIENVEPSEHKRKRERTKAKAYSYVSLVDGVVKTHKTWSECEARVKGKKARFKKALSREEEEDLIEEFGSSY